MKKTIATLGLVGLLSSGCATSEWKKACNEVEIPNQCSCYDYSIEWSKRANELGYNTRSVTFFDKTRKNMPHAIVELTQKDGQVKYIEPQNNWRVKVFSDDRMFPTNYRNGLISTNKYKFKKVESVRFH